MIWRASTSGEHLHAALPVRRETASGWRSATWAGLRPENRLRAEVRAVRPSRTL